MEASSHEAFDKKLFSDTKRMAIVDAVCYVYDSTDANSFAHIAMLRDSYACLKKIPSLVVATKSDLDRVSQRFPVHPDDYCRSEKLSAPISVSVANQQLAGLFGSLVETAIDSKFTTDPGTIAILGEQSRRRLIMGMTLGGSAMALLTAGILAYRLVSKRQ